MHRDWERVDKFQKTLPSENVTRNFHVKNNERVTLRFHPKTPTLERHYKDVLHAGPYKKEQCSTSIKILSEHTRINESPRELEAKRAQIFEGRSIFMKIEEDCKNSSRVCKSRLPQSWFSM